MKLLSDFFQLHAPIFNIFWEKPTNNQLYSSMIPSITQSIHVSTNKIWGHFLAIESRETFSRETCVVLV